MEGNKIRSYKAVILAVMSDRVSVVLINALISRASESYCRYDRRTRVCVLCINFRVKNIGNDQLT